MPRSCYGEDQWEQQQVFSLLFWVITYLSQAKFREEIVACVLDSPYASLWELLTRIASDKSGLPGFIV